MGFTLKHDTVFYICKFYFVNINKKTHELLAHPNNFVCLNFTIKKDFQCQKEGNIGFVH